MQPTLDGVRLKIQRAKKHVLEFEAAYNSWISPEKQDESAIVYPDFERKMFHLSIGEVRKTDPAWAAMIGDATHNLRSALDHMVFQLALLNGQPVSCATETFFPICITGKEFRNSTKGIKHLISPKALALLKECQPYLAAKLRDKNPRSHNLWIISELDIIDKHRMLVIASAFHRPIEVVYRINGGEPVFAPLGDVWIPTKEGAPIATIDLSACILRHEDKVQVQMKSELKIFINETGTMGDGLEVKKALVPCVNFVEAIVDECEKRFFSK